MGIMDIYQTAVKIYEEKRQEAAILEKKRLALIASCDRTTNANEWTPICLSEAYNETMQERKDNDEYYEFEEIFHNGVLEGKYCKNCYDSYNLKKGALKEARKEFGEAKRRLSRLGKMLIGS